MSLTSTSIAQLGNYTCRWIRRSGRNLLGLLALDRGSGEPCLETLIIHRCRSWRLISPSKPTALYLVKIPPHISIYAIIHSLSQTPSLNGRPRNITNTHAHNPQGAKHELQTNNQWFSLTDQLNMGVRVLELDVHFVAVGNMCFTAPPLL